MLGYAKPPPNLHAEIPSSQFSLLISTFIVVEDLLVFSVSYVGLRKASTQPTC
jgi:hypothetical protein